VIELEVVKPERQIMTTGLQIQLYQRLGVLPEQITDFCQRWKITQFALFGSVLRQDFHANSDIDVLVTFAPDAQKGLLTLAQMKHELEGMFGREVDLLTQKSIEQSPNQVRRRNILTSAQVVYVA
jgi:predicted nucleotidyltransferase